MASSTPIGTVPKRKKLSTPSATRNWRSICWKATLSARWHINPNPPVSRPWLSPTQKAPLGNAAFFGRNERSLRTPHWANKDVRCQPGLTDQQIRHQNHLRHLRIWTFLEKGGYEFYTHDKLGERPYRVVLYGTHWLGQKSSSMDYTLRTISPH